MEGYDAATYGDRIASVYDEWYQARMDPGPAVELLAELVGDGRALELGVGTGRIAIPLAERGVRVTGVDASRNMVDRLVAKPGGERVEVVIGDFTDVAVGGSFSLVYIPFTTLFALPSQDDQLRCLRNVANHLDPGGHFVMDAFVPDVARFRNHQDLSVQSIGTDQVVVDASRHDPVMQRVESSHVVFAEGGMRLYPVVVRYAWPAELDAMALAAGMRLKWRFADYDRHVFDAASTRHVSVYEKPLTVSDELP
jgi:SAM-dependent methyltransferase